MELKRTVRPGRYKGGGAPAAAAALGADDMDECWVTRTPVHSKTEPDTGTVSLKPIYAYGCAHVDRLSGDRLNYSISCLNDAH